MTLNQPYYIEPRKGENHLELDGEWTFFGAENARETFTESDFTLHSPMPLSLYHALHKSGAYPDPYTGTNSKLFRNVDEKVWYFRKVFTLDREKTGRAVLCFDGLSYYARLWLNGALLGDHEGMYGGPAVDVTDVLRYTGENELTVEVKAANYGKKDGYDGDNLHGTNREIMPWNLLHDGHTDNGDFTVVGIWNRVRLEFLADTHISRPYLYTEACDETGARLHFECEIVDGTVKELQPFYGYSDGCYTYTRAYDNGLTGARKDESVTVTLTLTEPDTGIPVFRKTETVPLLDRDRLGADPAFAEQQFYRTEITLADPRLWYPVGMGEPYRYTCTVTLSDETGILDEQTFFTGIRTFTASQTAGEKYRTRWQDFRFAVNGRRFFLRGVNWMPVDFLYNVDPKEYDWCVRLAANAGVQMLRIWSGGGMIETDTFYDLCDKYGILVWQDHLIANTPDTHSFPQDILEDQEAYNLYRIRNHPSLAIHCGGNEFNPYHTGNAASMFVQSRVVKTLDPSRLYHYTTADRGSAHIYRDMEPVWYRKVYRDLPFVAESGIHSFPTFKSLKAQIRKEEYTGIPRDLTSPVFPARFPELLNHFTEYAPSRVPRMMARASQITDVTNADIETLCTATQLQAYEFYTLMIGALRDNYPRTGGVIPWVFKRHRCTVGIQLVDGLGRPGLAYYALQNAYKPLAVCLRQAWSVIAPNEPVPLEVAVFNDRGENLAGAQVRVTVYAPDLTVAARYTAPLESRAVTFPAFVPDDRYTDTCFLIRTELVKTGIPETSSVNFVKCTSKLADPVLYEACREHEHENLFFENGPWLLDTLRAAQRTALTAHITDRGNDGRDWIDLRVHNTGAVAAYPVTVDTADDASRCYATDNVFLLAPDEIRNVRVTFDGVNAEKAKITVSAANADPVTV